MSNSDLITVRTSYTLKDLEVVQTAQELLQIRSRIIKKFGEDFNHPITKKMIDSRAHSNILNKSMRYYQDPAIINNTEFFNEAIDLVAKAYRRAPVVKPLPNPTNAESPSKVTPVKVDNLEKTAVRS